MYKLFLCLRYLRRRYLALIAVAAVMLCVAMVLIVVSVMDGFLRKVEYAAKGLFGEVVVDSASLSGIGRYDEFIAYLKEHVPEVEAATPVIYTYGLLRIGTAYTETVQIYGIRLPERLAVTDFKQGLYVQTGNESASFDPPIRELIARTRRHAELIENVRRRETALPPDKRDSQLLNKLSIAHDNTLHMIHNLDEARRLRRQIDRLEADISAEQAKPEQRRDAEKIRRLRRQSEQLSEDLARFFRPPSHHLILGLGIAGLSFRTPAGETIRLVGPGRKVVLTLLPIGRGISSTTVTPNTSTFTVIDDAKTDVYTFDSKTVYVPFETIQALADMDERRDVDDPSFVDPARCSQIQIKIKDEFASGRRLVEVRRKISNAWDKFLHIRPDAAGASVTIHTWREKLEKFVGPIEKQRTLVTIMFGIISFVSVLLIFAIFYMVVTQKIRDIGVVRAVGGSAAGVAQIFLGFGAATGLLGSALGLLGGYFFVRYINEIQDWLASWFGFRVWERDVFLFDKIPNEVDPAVAAVIAVWAITSGLVGALIPSVSAGVMEPVEAIRYE